jgi:hypothetical protein
MDSIFQALSQHAPQAILVLAILTLALGILTFSLASKIRRMNRKWRELLEGAKGDNLERMLYDHLRERMQVQTQIDGLTSQLRILEDKVQGSKRHLGLVKYDAFEDVGGNQSFAMALYDDRGDGALITSLIGRTDCRVYCKPLVGGRSERSLSQEEQRAIHDAANPGPKSIVS